MAFKPIQILINAKDNASAVFDKLQTKVAAVGAAILGYFGIQAFAGVVRGAADFEAAMSRVQAATGAGADEMQRLTKAAKEGAAQSGFSNVETADALTNLAKAGADATQAMEALPGVIALAQAGEVGLAESSEYLTKIMAAMGGKFSDAAKYADVLAMGANASNTSVTGLAQGLSYAAPAANALGLSLETTVGILGKFADGGIDASRAGTALNAILSQFLDPASKFRNELALAGITTTNFEEALKQLAVAGPRGANAILAVGTEAGPALRGLLNQGLPALQQLIDRLQGAEGSAAATAKTLRDNLQGSLGALGNAWQNVKDVLGAPVLPVLKQAVDELTTAFRRATEDGTVQRFGEAIATAFRNGIQFFKDFASSIDFGAVLARLQKFADDANATLTKVGEYATNAGNTVKLAYGVMSTGGNAVLLTIYGIAAAYTEAGIQIVKFAAASSEALAKIAIGDAKEKLLQQAADMQVVLSGLAGVRDEFIKHTQQSLDAMADSAVLAREGFSGIASGLSEAGEQGERTSKAIAAVATELSRGAEAAAAYGVAMQKKANAEVLAQQAAADHAEKVEELEKRYAELRASGNINEAIKVFDALTKVQRQGALTAEEYATKQARVAQEVEAAFKQLGIVSSAALKSQAELSAKHYETIRTSGLATAEDLSNAFRKAAEDAIAANKGVAPSWVEAEAAARGYRIAVDEAGRATLEAANNAAPGLDRMARGWHGAREAIQAQEDAMDRLMMKYTMSADYTERQIALLEREAAAAERAAEAYRKKWNMDQEGYSLNTAGQRVMQGETQEQVDADVARRYGDQNVGNPDAQRARQLAVLLSMITQLGGQVTDPGSSKQIAEMRRELQQLNERLLNSGTPGADQAAAAPARSPAAAPVRQAAVAGPTNNIQIYVEAGADFSSRAAAERLARQLLPAIADLNRKGFRA